MDSRYDFAEYYVWWFTTKRPTIQVWARVYESPHFIHFYKIDRIPQL
jgi:hypothetical protein